jgi:hypothetical protein
MNITHTGSVQLVVNGVSVYLATDGTYGTWTTFKVDGNLFQMGLNTIGILQDSLERDLFDISISLDFGNFTYCPTETPIR